MGSMREISVQECKAVFGGQSESGPYDTRSYRDTATRWNTYSYDNVGPGQVVAIGFESGLRGGEGHYSESGHFVAPDGRLYENFQACVEAEAQEARDEDAEFVGAFGPIGAAIADVYSEQGPNRKQENVGINTCHGANIVGLNN